jgi:exodeoxyribonuclease V alpha subunit
MSTWTSPTSIAPEIDLLVRRWNLPPERSKDVEQLLKAQREGSTAYLLPDDTPRDTQAWGSACQVIEHHSATGAPSPLVLRHHEGRAYLQSWRFFRAEQAIAKEIIVRAHRSAPKLLQPVSSLLTDLGPNQVNERQAAAITCALEHTLALIVGGPGTGKTHTLARLIALLVADNPEKLPIIHLAAPTGKAADRMKEAVETAADRLPASLPLRTKELLKAAAAGASTLHRLLGFNPSTGRCRYNPERRLRCDVLIIDECSMIDSLLWLALLAALEPNTRLVLVGDPHQLESVSAGNVLGSIVRFAKATPGSALDRVQVELTESQRFRNRAGIGALAKAVVNCAADSAVLLLETHAVPADGSAPADGLTWLGDHNGRFNWEKLPNTIQAAITAVADAPNAPEALAALAQIRLLTAHREGSMGAAGLNEAIQRHLGQRRAVKRAPNRPIIIGHNDPETGLTNGSIGIIMEVEGTSAAYFPPASAGAPPRKIPLGRMPDFSPAWALTIHRSQGSEFDQVVVVLPPDESPLATRELIYTAITRASQCVHVWGGEPTVRAALQTKTERCTLLECSLAAG